MEYEKAVEILLVEDNDDDAELTLMAFKKHKFANIIIRIRDGAEALDYLFCRRQFISRNINQLPKIILLDLKLPKVSGFEVLKAVKSNDILKSIPVIIMTSSQEEKDIVRSYELGVNSFITKPVLMEEFMEVVYNLGFYWLLINEANPNI
jgi:DNA-binding response OmpR family regulator